MKLTCILLAGLMACGSAAAGDELRPGPERKREGRPGMDRDKRFPRPDEVWRKADSNSDGSISAEEFAAMERPGKLPEEARKKIFDRLDKDGSGSIERSEWPSMGKDSRGRGFPRLAELDVDGSGGVSFEEFQQSSWIKRMPEQRQREVFSRMDQNGDGQISPEDHPRRGRGPRGGEGRPGPRPDPKRMLRMLDKNDDGVLEFEEFRNSPRVRNLGEDEQEGEFEKLDKNGDLKLDESELKPEFKPDGRRKGPRGREGGGPRPDRERPAGE